MARSPGCSVPWVFTACLLMLAFGIASGQDALNVKGELALTAPLGGPLDTRPVLLLAQKAIEEPAPSEKEKPAEGLQAEKSPAKAFVFSVLVPGSGELYVGAKRGYIFLGVEAIAWTSSYFLRKSGQKKEDEYLDFADAHWSFANLPALGDTCSWTGSRLTQEQLDLLYYFYDHNKQHFYEDIGKQPFYVCGWDSRANLETYLDMRDKSNWLLKNSNYAIMAAVVNHVISAVDALRLARNYNANLGHGVRLNFKVKTSPHSSGIMVVASRKF